MICLYLEVNEQWGQSVFLALFCVSSITRFSSSLSGAVEAALLRLKVSSSGVGTFSSYRMTSKEFSSDSFDSLSGWRLVDSVGVGAEVLKERLWELKTALTQAARTLGSRGASTGRAACPECVLLQWNCASWYVVKLLEQLLQHHLKMKVMFGYVWSSLRLLVYKSIDWRVNCRFYSVFFMQN